MLVHGSKDYVTVFAHLIIFGGINFSLGRLLKRCDVWNRDFCRIGSSRGSAYSPTVRGTSLEIKLSTSIARRVPGGMSRRRATILTISGTIIFITCTNVTFRPVGLVVIVAVLLAPCHRCQKHKVGQIEIVEGVSSVVEIEMRVIHCVGFLLQRPEARITLCFQKSVFVRGDQDNIFGNNLKDIETIEVCSLAQGTELGIKICIEFSNALLRALFPSLVLESSKGSFEVSCHGFSGLIAQYVKAAFVKGSPCFSEARVMGREGENAWR